VVDVRTEDNRMYIGDYLATITAAADDTGAGSAKESFNDRMPALGFHGQ